MSIYDSLNPMQQEAVFCTEGPLLVLAGAGSGKTRVLTHRVAYLIEEKEVNPWNIMAITFTNKAAGEMRERVDKLVGFGAESIWVSTFHSSCVRILRRHIEALGYSTSFSIYDTDDQRTLMKQVFKTLDVDTKQLKERGALSAISSAKDKLIGPEEFLLNATGDFRQRRIGEIYQEYQKQLKKNNAMDFDDLIVKTVELFQNNPDVLSYYQERFKYIMVDEYQDTNLAQFKLISLLAAKYKNLCVVGDDDQSIYKFRGANIENILNFEDAFPGARVIKLEQNYRSTQNILNAANGVIRHNRGRKDKTLWTANSEGTLVHFKQFENARDEADYVARQIRDSGFSYQDQAVLYRTNAQSRLLEERCIYYNVPYRLVGGVNFYQRKEIKDIIAYFRLVVNPNDEEAFKRIINYPARGIGDTTVGKIITAATDNNVSLWTALCEPITYGLSINKGTHTKLQDFRALIEQFMADVTVKNAYEIGTEIIRQSGIINEVCQDNSPENLSRKENIEELVNGMNDFCAMRQEEGNTNVSLIDFLSEVSLLTDQDSDKEGDGEKVTLMTVHSAKGLEFRNVFVVGMEENLFPSGMAGDSPRAMEEERRLFYVAITRAEEHCFLSFAKTRFRYGKMEFGSPSRFLRDIDTRFLQLPQEAALGRSIDEGAGRFRREMEEGYSRRSSSERFSARPSADGPERERPKAQIIAPTVPRNLKKVSGTTLSPSSASGAGVAGVQPGQTIEHERFGLGEVIRVEGTGDNAKATIHFRNAGDKQLLLRFARFKVIE